MSKVRAKREGLTYDFDLDRDLSESQPWDKDANTCEYGHRGKYGKDKRTILS